LIASNSEGEQVAAYCGIDWAEGYHDIAVVDDQGTLLAKRRVDESPAGLAELIALLVGIGDDVANPIPVAIETPRGLLVAALRATGRPIYPINPMAVARYRERTSLSGKKSDHVDAMALANILRTDRHLHRLLPDDSPEVRAISVLARGYQDAVWRRRCCKSSGRGWSSSIRGSLLRLALGRGRDRECRPRSSRRVMRGRCWRSRRARPMVGGCR